MSDKLQTVTVGAGKKIHWAYYNAVDRRSMTLCRLGGLVVTIDLPVTCKRCQQIYDIREGDKDGRS